MSTNLFPRNPDFDPTLSDGLRSVLHRLRNVMLSADVTNAGAEARLYVRAALAVDTPAERDALVLDVLAGRAPDTAWMGETQRARAAAAVIRGWVDGHPEARPDCIAWHRSFPGVRVLVGSSAAAAAKVAAR